MTKTSVVHCKKSKYDIYIGRPSMWGNPFILGRDGNRDDVVDKYKDWIKGRPDLLERINTLRGKRLGCFCSPNRCHGDTLAELADESNP